MKAGKTVYDYEHSCNKCGGYNELIDPDYHSGHLHESKTKCEQCGFEDYWAYGFFESHNEGIESKSKKYVNNSGVLKHA